VLCALVDATRQPTKGAKNEQIANNNKVDIDKTSHLGPSSRKEKQVIGWGHNFLKTRETQYKNIVFNFDLREWLLQRLSFVIRQRVVVVRLGLFSPDERKIKIEMKKTGKSHRT
jgi:hypothetical protein